MEEIKLDTRKCKQLLKWGRSTFVCLKCTCINHINGKDFTRVCAICKTKHSITSFTMFHNVRFGLLEAFRILFEDFSNSYQSKRCFIAKKYKISETTAGKFLKKIRTNQSESHYWIYFITHSDEQHLLKEYSKKLNDLRGKEIKLYLKRNYQPNLTTEIQDYFDSLQASSI